MSLIPGTLSIIKGIIRLLNGVLAIITKRRIKNNSINNSIVQQAPGIGIRKSIASITRAKNKSTIPPGEKRISEGIFESLFPPFFFISTSSLGVASTANYQNYFDFSLALLIFATSSGAVVIN